MADKMTYSGLERKIKKLEKEAFEYMRREREINKKRKLSELGHMRRTLSLMKINEELNKEIKRIKSTDSNELEQISHKLRGRIKELNCLYEISSFRKENNFSLEGILQEIVDFIPQACQDPEITCARITLNSCNFKTKNFKDTKWKLSQKIKVNNETIGILEVCRLKERSEYRQETFLEEEKRLFGAIAECIDRIVEREWAEEEIRKWRNRVEELTKLME